MVKGIAVLGSTGSIGRQALEVVRAFPERLRVVSLASGGKKLDLLQRQVEEFRPPVVAVADARAASALRPRLPSGVTLVVGQEGLAVACGRPEVAMVLNAIGGVEGLAASRMAVQAGKDLALANKESLVLAGSLLLREINTRGTRLLPVDSEHVALHQCLAGQPRAVERLILTASGGPFRHLPLEALANVTPAMALEHPTWKMGPKITVDSATLMNKALEVIEAHWLFGIPWSQIEVVIHPQSIVHSLVAFGDGMVLAQLGPADMRLPIQYALSWPERWPSPFGKLRLEALPALTFEAPDEKRFPCLRLGRLAGEKGGTYPAVLAAADEAAVELFLEGRIGFLDIPRLVEEALARHGPVWDPTWEDIEQAVIWARRWVKEGIGK